jgi:hypothetical protein
MSAGSSSPLFLRHSWSLKHWLTRTVLHCWHPQEILLKWSANCVSGTVFYFAAESEDELLLWMDCITLATFKQDFSKTGQESEGNVFLLCFSQVSS